MKGSAQAMSGDETGVFAQVARSPVVRAVAGVALLVLTVARLRALGGFLFDFNGDLYRAGAAILHGRDPYDPAYLTRLAAAMREGGWVSSAFALPVYPAPMLLVAVPFALVAQLPSGLLFLALMVAAMIVGLRLLGVRDRRCTVVALASWPFLYGLWVGALGPLLVLGIGVAWRWRDRLWPPGLAVAGVVVAKLFPWTLPIWLLITGRRRAFMLSIAIGAAALFAAWGLIGFAGLRDYPRMLADLANVERGAGVSVVSLLITMDVPGAAAELVGLAVVALMLGVAYRVARRPRGAGPALGLVVIAALIGSPIVWPHYFVLLFVAIALVSPRLSVLWFLPLLTVLVPTPQGVFELLLWQVLAAGVALAAWRCLPEGGPSASPASEALTRAAGRLIAEPQPSRIPSSGAAL